ncbi:MAG TPA: HIT family protein [Methylomirabilota bacterium]|nr:HIT family protein [Methylomirabilota bacterium]
MSGKRAHVVAFHDMDDVEIADAATLIRKIVKAAGLDHYTVLQNNGALGGQTVFHVHFHLVLAWNEIERLHVERVTRAPVDHGDFGQKVRAVLA